MLHNSNYKFYHMYVQYVVDTSLHDNNPERKNLLSDSTVKSLIMEYPAIKRKMNEVAH